MNTGSPTSLTVELAKGTTNDALQSSKPTKIFWSRGVGIGNTRQGIGTISTLEL